MAIVPHEAAVGELRARRERRLGSPRASVARGKADPDRDPGSRRVRAIAAAAAGRATLRVLDKATVSIAGNARAATAASADAERRSSVFGLQSPDISRFAR
jgi:hypothetical protein